MTHSAATTIGSLGVPSLRAKALKLATPQPPRRRHYFFRSFAIMPERASGTLPVRPRTYRNSCNREEHGPVGIGPPFPMRGFPHRIDVPCACRQAPQTRGSTCRDMVIDVKPPAYPTGGLSSSRIQRIIGTMASIPTLRLSNKYPRHLSAGFGVSDRCHAALPDDRAPHSLLPHRSPIPGITVPTSLNTGDPSEPARYEDPS